MEENWAEKKGRRKIYENLIGELVLLGRKRDMTVIGLTELENSEREGGRMGKEWEIAEKSFVPVDVWRPNLVFGGLGRNQSMNNPLMHDTKQKGQFDL